MRVKFGINFMPTAPPPEVVGWAREVERFGYEILGISDSQSICRDVYVTLALCATHTERIRFGSRALIAFAIVAISTGSNERGMCR